MSRPIIEEMKRLLLAILVMAFALSACAQQSSTSQQPLTWSDRAVAASIAFAKNVWERVQKEGQPFATKMLKTAPEYYKGVQKSVQDFVKKVQTSEIPQTFSEKQQLALELWKLRGAINVMALSDPEVLKMLLNIQPAAVQKMQKDLKQTEGKLKKANVAGI